MSEKGSFTGGGSYGGDWIQKMTNENSSQYRAPVKNSIPSRVTQSQRGVQSKNNVKEKRKVKNKPSLSFKGKVLIGVVLASLILGAGYGVHKHLKNEKISEFKNEHLAPIAQVINENYNENAYMNELISKEYFDEYIDLELKDIAEYALYENPTMKEFLEDKSSEYSKELAFLLTGEVDVLDITGVEDVLNSYNDYAGALNENVKTEEEARLYNILPQVADIYGKANDSTKEKLVESYKATICKESITNRREAISERIANNNTDIDRYKYNTSDELLANVNVNNEFVKAIENGDIDNIDINSYGPYIYYHMGRLNIYDSVKETDSPANLAKVFEGVMREEEIHTSKTFLLNADSIMKNSDIASFEDYKAHIENMNNRRFDIVSEFNKGINKEEAIEALESENDKLEDIRGTINKAKSLDEFSQNLGELQEEYVNAMQESERLNTQSVRTSRNVGEDIGGR